MGSKNDGGRSAAMAQAAAEAQRARETLAAVNEPDYVKMQKLIDQMESPELVGLLQAEQLSPSALEGISLDPKLRQAQMEALTQVQEKAEAGLTPAEKARRRELSRQAAAEAQSQQAAVLQSFAERGMAGSGNELAARLAAQQGSADRASQTSDRLAQDIENARMSATAQAAQQAGALRSQDYGEAENVARARDAIAQFNAQNRQNIAAQNLGERQRISEARTGTRNLQRQQTSGLQQQQFENAYRKAGGQAAASQNLSQMYMQQASMAQPKQGLGGLIGTAAGAGLGAYATGGSPQGALAGAQVGGMVGSQFGCGGVKKEYADGGLPSLQAGGANVNESFADTLAPTQKYDRAMAGFAQNRADELDRFGGDPYAAAMYGKKDRSTSESLDAVRNSPLGQKIFGSSQASSVAPQATPDALSKPEASPTPEKGADISAGLQGLASILGKQQAQPKQEMYKPQLLDLRAQNFEDGGNKPIERSPKAVSEVGSEPMPPRQRTYSSLKDIIAESIKEKELESTSPTGTSYACGGTKKGMAYEDGGQGTVIPGDSYSGDNLPDRINSGEAVHNVEQQNRLNDLLLELKKLKTGKRTDEMLSEGELEVNPDQQEALMEVVRGQRDVTDLPDESVVQESGGMKKLMEMLARKK